MKKMCLLFVMLLVGVAWSQEAEQPSYFAEENARMEREMEPLLRTSDLSKGNVARGKSYIFSETPNMGNCTGDSDVTDLTNGKSDSSASGIWFCSDCVGWNSKQLVSITIDLKKKENINRAKVFSGGGRAGVFLPSVALVEVSEDGKNYYCVGDLVAMSRVAIPREGIGHHPFAFEGKFEPVKARYVRITLRPVGQYLCLTEIEIFKTKQKGADCNTLPPALSAAEINELGKKAAISVRIRENMVRLLEQLDGDPQELADLKQEILHWNFTGEIAGYKPIYPLAPVQEKIFALHAAKLRESGNPDVILQPVDFYAGLSPVALPTDGKLATMGQTMMNNEVRGTALVVCNTTETAKEFAVSLEGLDGEVYETCYIDSEYFYPTSTYLRPATTLRAVPGMVTELAVVLRPTCLAPGKHQGFLVLQEEGQDAQKLPIELEILPQDFPAIPQLVLYGWEYLDSLPGAKNAWQGIPVSRFAEFRAMRNADLCFGTAGVGAQELAACTHAIKVSPEGDILDELDFKIFDRGVDDNPEASIYMVVGIGQNLQDGTFGTPQLQPETPAFNRAVEEWARQWNEHVLSRGLQGRVIFQIYDEPGLNSQRDHIEEYKLVQQWHRPFHKGAPDIPLFINPCNEFPEGASQYLDNAEIICPEVELIHSPDGAANLTAFRKLREEGHVFHTYSCSHGPYMSEPGAFRNQAWMTFLLDGVGTGFWGSTNMSLDASFNRYVAQGHHFSQYLLDEEGLHRTKHAFALRDAVQDFEYLKLCQSMLKDAAEQGQVMVEQETRLDELVRSVAAPREKFTHGGTNMAVRAEEARLAVIEIIKALNKEN